ncbi:MAG: hypothetical protein FHK80_00835 [Azoarcus sp. PHD]|nr:MAG: hypothetical protein FHK80_00835 [Azoarcus sp. PHD]
MTIDERNGEADARTKEKGHAEAQPTSKTTGSNFTAPDQRKPYAETDPVAGWHELANSARLLRKIKRTWRRKDGGAVQGDLLALLILATVAGVLLVGVVR